jgi:hypothetical protein
VEGAVRGGAGAVDGDLETVKGFVIQIFRRHGFEIRATTQAPGGLDDFSGERPLERRVWREFGEIAGLELIKDVLFFGADEIRDREETALFFGRAQRQPEWWLCASVAFCETRAVSETVTGPWDLSAFRRLAGIRAGVAILSPNILEGF